MTTIPSVDEILAATDEQNTAALEEYAQASRIKTLFKDGVLYAAFHDGEVLSARFDLSFDDYEELSKSDDEPMTQFRKVLELTGGKDVAKKLLKRSAGEATQFTQTWFKTFEKLQSISLGE